MLVKNHQIQDNSSHPTGSFRYPERLVPPYFSPISVLTMGSTSISYSDIRRIEGERGIETYLGIQRPLDPKRVRELEHYVSSPDACFPTAVIIAVPAECARSLSDLGFQICMTRNDCFQNS
jgi:hypothetical protein